MSFEIGQTVLVKAEVKTEYADKHKEGDGWKLYREARWAEPEMRAKNMYRREFDTRHELVAQRRTIRYIGLLYSGENPYGHYYSGPERFTSEAAIPVYLVRENRDWGETYQVLPEDMED